MGQGGGLSFDGYVDRDGLLVVTSGSVGIAEKYKPVCSWRMPSTRMCMRPTEWLPTVRGVEAALCMKHAAQQMREEVKGDDATARDYNQHG